MLSVETSAVYPLQPTSVRLKAFLTLRHLAFELRLDLGLDMGLDSRFDLAVDLSLDV